jgi:hypothetical protein
MKIEEIKDHPYFNLPIVGGLAIIALQIWLMAKRLGAVKKKDSETLFERKYINDNGSIYKKKEYGSVLPPLLLVALIGILIELTNSVVNITHYLFSSPLVLLLPFCVSGFIASLQKESINEYLKGKPSDDRQLSFHFILGFFVSFVIAWYLAKTEHVFELRDTVDFLFIYIPASLYIFLGFLAPISIGITFTATHFKIEKQHSSRKKSTRLMVITGFLLTLIIASKHYYTHYNLANAPARKAANIQKDKEDGIAKNIRLLKEKKSAIRVQPNINACTVEILTYGGTYFKDMIVPSGVHKIQVSRQGYNTETITINAKYGLTIVSANLTEMTKRDKTKARKRSNELYKKRASLLTRKATLKFNLEPRHARVEILNSKKTYTNDMIVDAGKYDIRVSAQGYITHTETYKAEIGGYSENIQLRKIDSAK